MTDTEPTAEQRAEEARDRLLRDLEKLRHTAERLRDGDHGLTIEDLAPLVADWIDGECAAISNIEPFVELISATISRTDPETGDTTETGALRILRKSSGDLVFSADTSVNAYRIAGLVVERTR